MSSETPLVQMDGVTVRYGRRIALDGVTLQVARGAVHALLGRNGAGKSSLVRCLLGQQRPQRGVAYLFSEDVWRRRASLMQRIGVVPEDPDAPPEMTIGQLERFSAALYARWDRSSFEQRVRRMELDPKAKFGDLSKGQKKQVSLALALASSPDLLVLDDPTLGLDVVARKNLFEEVIAELAERGITVLLTTHDLAGVEGIADHVSVLKEGRIVLDEEVETLKQRFRRIRFFNQVPATAAPFRVTATKQWGSATEAVVTDFDELAFERFRASSGVPAPEVTPMSLEEIFIALAGEKNGGLS